MVTDNNGIDPNDPLSQDQQELDQQQGITSEGEVGSVPTGPTNQQLAENNQALASQNQYLSDQIQQLAAQGRGLQSKIDTGLNSIRADAKAWAEDQIGGLRADLENKAFIDSLDEEQRPLAEGLIQRLAPVREPQPQVNPAEAGVPENVTQRILAAWQPVVSWVEQMGVSKADPRVNWNLMANENAMPEESRQNVFRDHIISLRSQEVQQPAQVNPQPNPQGDNPPVLGGGNAGDGNLRTTDAVRDAYIENRISVTDMEDRMRALGEPI